MTISFVIFVFVFDFVFFFSFLFKMCTVGLHVSLCLMIILCPFLHCKALRTAMYKPYVNSIIIITIISSLPFYFAGGGVGGAGAIRQILAFFSLIKNEQKTSLTFCL